MTYDHDALYGPLITMRETDGRLAPYAQNPVIGMAVRFLPMGHSPIRYGWVSMLTDIGPNNLCEPVIVTDDKHPRRVYFIGEIMAWSEIRSIPE